MPGTEKFRILAVDDDRDILELINISLGEKFDVFGVSDPMNACETLELVEPELVVLDVMMPKVTGYQIAEFIKKVPSLQHVIVIFLSAKDTPRDVKYGYKLGANFYLTKPFQPDRLAKTVEMMLAEHYPSHLPRPKSHAAKDVRARLEKKVPSWQTAAVPLSQLPKAATPSSGRLPKANADAEEGPGIGKKDWVG